MSDTSHTTAGPRIDQPTGTQTVGHEWDGIEELNTPLPRWWLLTFYASVLWAIAYVIAYPAWPMVSDYTRGLLGWSSRGELAAELAADKARRAPMMAAIAATPIESLPAQPRLMQAAVEGGKAAFKVHCVQCHGSGAAGSPGYPNLNDDDWLWGGDLTSLEYSILHGIRNPDHAETRMSQMPAFGRDGILQPAQIDDVVAYVRTLGKLEKPSVASARGSALYTANCVVCHGPQGKGDRKLGAPNLTDGIWLYGGDTGSLRNTIANARYGVMPRWGERLGEAQVRMLAAYVHSLGGGEAAAPAEPAADAGNMTTAQ